MIIAVIFATALTALAQPNLGIRAGYTCSSLGLQKHDAYQWRSGFNVGVVADFGWKERLTFRPGVYFVQKGYDYNGYGYNYKSMNYLEMPLLLVLKEPIGESAVLELQIGPYLACGIGGKTEEYWQGMTEHVEKHGTFEKKGFNERFDFGLTPGIGISSGHFYAGVSYDFGALFHNSIHLFNQCFMANVGYNF